MCPVYLCITHGRVPRSHAYSCSAFRADLNRWNQRMKGSRDVRLKAEKELDMQMSPPKPKRRDRHEKLMDVRVKYNQGFMGSDVTRDAVDYLFFEIDLLIHQVEELKDRLALAQLPDPGQILSKLEAMPFGELKAFVDRFNGPLPKRRKKS